MNKPSLYHRIETLSERAAIDSGTSYEEYIRLFTLYFEQSFKTQPKQAQRIAAEFGYTPIHARKRWRAIAA